MENKKVYIETHGCQMNVDDSLRMGQLLKPLNYQITETPKEADLILINTCSIREKASRKARSAIGRFHHLKIARPEILLGLTGCQAQAEGKVLLDRFSYLNFVLGPDQIKSLPEVIESLEKKKTNSINKTERIKPNEFDFVSLTPDPEESIVSAYVTIMKGCDNFCSFCIVPFVRGREVSRAPDEIIEEIRKLTAHGVKEVNLLGQNVNSYGTKKGAQTSFVDLLKRISQETEIQRIRFITSHPKDVGEDLINAYAEIPQLAKHLHLPVQSGSTSILEKMYRTYTREEFLKITRSLQKVCPDVSITTDIIVGFPGETDEDFEQTLSLVDEVQFDASYSFLYSSRPHTTAGRYLKDEIPKEVKEKRLKTLQEKQAEITLRQNEKCVGEISEVLVQGSSKWGESLQGRTSQYRIVHLNINDESLVGQIVPVKIVKACHNSLTGEIITRN